MRIQINMEICLNAGQCAYLHPELFDLDDDGVPIVLVTDELTDEQVEAARAAADSCPSQAISVVES